MTLSAPSDEPVTVLYRTGLGTAVAGQDFVAQRGTLTFAPGVTQQDILIEILGDTQLGARRDLRGASLHAERGGAARRYRGLSPSPMTMACRLRMSTTIEGHAGSPGSMVFEVRLLTAASQAVTVDYATADGSATAGVDYTATSGSLTFDPGDTVEVRHRQPGRGRREREPTRHSR